MQTNADGEALIVRLSGGLGNQMFQFAFGSALVGDRRLSFDLADLDRSHTRSFSLGCFGLNLDFSRFPLMAGAVTTVPGMWKWIRAFRHSVPLANGRLIWDAMKGFDPRWSEFTGSLYAVGYWQDERYFRSISDQIRNHFTFSRECTSETNDLLSLSNGAVGVQVRRGDYTNAMTSRVHPPQGVDFFTQSVKHITERHDVRRVIVSTDDTAWAREHLDLPGFDVVFRSNEAPVWEDMMVLSRCDHVVISNSSFGWWSAWLGSEDRTVVCPSRWFGRGWEDFKSPAMSHWTTI
ncbi:MAG: hypothetical protein CMJ33_04075 [Phycisphaerae bacterium]|nr:hypothetical protein [Phycisphaerae bacterium]